MNDKDFTEIFEKTNALMYGHFILSSGLRSDAYFQCAKVLQYPEYLTIFSALIAKQFIKEKPDVVISTCSNRKILNCNHLFSEESDLANNRQSLPRKKIP